MSLRAQKLSGRFISVEICHNQVRNTRLGVTVTKSYGCAVVRNRFKRVVREGFRSCYSLLPQGTDIIVRPRHEAATMKSSDVHCELVKLLGTL